MILPTAPELQQRILSVIGSYPPGQLRAESRIRSDLGGKDDERDVFSALLALHANGKIRRGEGRDRRCWGRK